MQISLDVIILPSGQDGRDDSKIQLEDLCAFNLLTKYIVKNASKNLNKRQCCQLRIGYAFLYPIFHQCKALSELYKALPAGHAYELIICNCVGSVSEVTFCASIPSIACSRVMPMSVLMLFSTSKAWLCHFRGMTSPLSSVCLCTGYSGKQIYKISLFFTFELWRTIMKYCVMETSQYVAIPVQYRPTIPLSFRLTNSN